jgi:hypothetical protein
VIVDHVTGGVVPADVSLSGDGRSMTVAPAAALDVSRRYSLLMSGRDLAGNPLPFVGFFFYTFTTWSDADTAPPQIVATNPGDGQAAVPRNVRVQVLFDEAIDPTSLDDVALTVGGLPLVITMSLTNANRTLAISAGNSLAPNTAHVLRIAGIRDTARNQMAADVIVTFTTGAFFDLRPPSIVAVTPTHGATDVPLTAFVEVRFDEPIDPLTILGGTMVLRLANTGASVPAAIACAPDRRTCTLTPASPLDPATQYTTFIGFGISDQAGNVLTTPIAVTFTTQP